MPDEMFVCEPIELKTQAARAGVAGWTVGVGFSYAGTRVLMAFYRRDVRILADGGGQPATVHGRRDGRRASRVQ